MMTLNLLLFLLLLSNTHMWSQAPQDASISGQEVPAYFQLLQESPPNIHKIHTAYADHLKEHGFKKDDYFRAYRDFYRAYPLSNFDDNGNPIKPTKKNRQRKFKTSSGTIGSAWDAVPVSIDRNDCYYTGQNGVVSAIDVDRNNPNIVLAGSLAGLLFKSNDKGITWSENLIKNLPRVNQINEIAISPTNSSIVYAATDVGVIKSIDGGTTFNMTSIDYRASFPNVNFGGDDYRSEYMWVDVARDNPNVIAASDINPQGLESHVSVSVNGGQNWNKYSFGYKNFPMDVTFHPTNSNIIYVLILDNTTRNFSFYKSTNRGQSYQKITNGIPDNNNPNNAEIRFRLAVSAAQPSLVALYMNVGSDGQGFYKSTDHGSSFSKICCGSAGDVVNQSADNRDFYGEGYHAVQVRWATKMTISDTDANFVAASSNRAPRFSYNQMKDWYWTSDQVNIPSQPKNVLSPTCGTFMHGDIKDIVIRGNDVWVANDGGLVLSEDRGKTYVERADGLPITMALGFDMTQDKRDIIVAAMDHNGIIVRDRNIYQDRWKPMGGGDASGASINPIQNLWIYGRPSGSNIFERPSTGPSHGHPSYNSGFNFGSGYRSQYNNVQVHPNNYNILYSTDYTNFQIRKSTDNGSTWQNLLPITNNSWNYAEVKVSHSQPEYLYVTESVSTTNRVMLSTNGGQTWTNRTPSNLPANYRVRNVEIDSENPNHAWLSLNHGSTPKVFRTTNGGQTWEDYSDGLDGYYIYSMIHQKGSKQGVYVGTRFGVYYRDNTMSSWVKYGDDLPGTRISFLKINYAHNKIRAGTIAGIFENSLYEQTAPQANLSMDKNSVSCGGYISFADHSVAGAAATYSWSFPGGSPSYSTAERPVIQYNEEGSYPVVLQVTDARGQDTYTYENIQVSGNCATVNCGSSNLSINVTTRTVCPNEGIVFGVEVDNPIGSYTQTWSNGYSFDCGLYYSQGPNQTIADGSKVITDLCAGHALQYFDFEIYTNCYAKVASIKGFLSTQQQSISVLEYIHFDGSTSITGDGTNTVTSESADFGKIQFSTNGSQLYMRMLEAPCGSTSSIRVNNGNVNQTWYTNTNPESYYTVTVQDESGCQRTAVMQVQESACITYDCPEIQANTGDACNDNDPCTNNDMYDANCNCTGILQDSDGDGICDAEECPSLSPTIFLDNTLIVGGPQQIQVTVEVAELEGAPTATPVRLFVTHDPRYPFAFDNTMSSMAGRAVDNGDWTYVGSNGVEHEFVCNSTIAANGKTAFGLRAMYDPQSTSGETTFSVRLDFGTGGDCVFGNNFDDESVVYFGN